MIKMSSVPAISEKQLDALWELYGKCVNEGQDSAHNPHMLETLIRTLPVVTERENYRFNNGIRQNYREIKGFVPAIKPAQFRYCVVCGNEARAETVETSRFFVMTLTLGENWNECCFAEYSYEDDWNYFLNAA